MKRTFILLFALLSLNMAYGQDKEVAVLQPKTMQGTVSNNDKLIIVSSMKKAFTQIDGYKAFTRSSQALIDAEQEFQRSGKVSEASIKKMGEQNGAAFICTFTLSLENNELVVNSDIIDVESGSRQYERQRYMNNSIFFACDSQKLACLSIKKIAPEKNN
ncbi:hypothetical protein FACS1894199_17520 [Bacteroidia bacterium]|nr:hypothetical protein FACS1894199_17520 [Bacteroidia bacterium]